MKNETCEKINCSLPPNHDGWHVKKGARGKIIISWLDGHWKSGDQVGTYCYQEPYETPLERAKRLHPSNQHPVELDSPRVEGEPKFGYRPNLPFPNVPH